MALTVFLLDSVQSFYRIEWFPQNVIIFLVKTAFELLKH